ncbi:MAG: hypothetical protein KDA90_04850, partial [Planctomycetaceae bacterium]|nr:hypothetical protein [Planctomycetaceae bacterium]
GMVDGGGQTPQRVYLGGLPYLQWPAPTVSAADNVEFKAQSLVQVTPMQLAITTVLTLPASPEVNERILQLPGQAIIRSVQGAAGTEWGVVGAKSRDTMLRVTSQPQSASHVLRLEYELLPHVDETQSVSLPPIPLLASGMVSHEIGFSTGPGWNLGLPVSSGAGRVELVPHDELTGLLLNAAGVQQYIRMTTPQQLLLPLIPVEQVTMASVTEQCHVQRSQLEWETQFEISTGPLPQFVHRFRVSPDWRIREVKVEQMGVTQPVRWDQRGTDLTAFLDDQGLGNRKLIIICSRALPTETWTGFPKLELADAQIQDRQLSILDETNWIVEVETNGGSVMATPAALPAANSGDDSGAPRASRLQFRGAGVAEPRRLRIVPSPDAARAETVLALQPAGASGWRMTQMIHVEALDAPLKRIQLLVPTELADKLSLYPTNLRRSMSPGDQGMTTLTLFVPARLRDAITFSLAFDVDEQTITSQAIPLPEVTSAAQGLKLLVLDTATGLRVPTEGGMAISGAALPAWSPRPWSSAVRSRDAVCYQLSKSRLRMSRRENIVQDTHLPWAEHLIWLRSDGRLTGQTQLWGISHEQVMLQIRLPQHVTIDAVRSETSAPVLMPLDEGSSHRRVILPDVDGLFEFTIHWQSDEPLQSIVPLPQFAPLQPTNSVVGIVHGHEWEAVPVSGMHLMSPADAWLARWNGLLDCLDEVPTVVSVESPIMHRIRRNQQEAELSRQNSGEGFQQRFSIAQERWDKLQGELLLDADTTSRWQPAHDNLGTALALRDPSVQWFELHEPVTSISIRPREETTHRQLPWWLLGAIAATATALTLVTDRFRIRERLAIRPALGIMLMGAIWWSWLYPSIFGLVLFLCGLLMLAWEFFWTADDESGLPASS